MSGCTIVSIIIFESIYWCTSTFWDNIMQVNFTLWIQHTLHAYKISKQFAKDCSKTLFLRWSNAWDPTCSCQRLLIREIINQGVDIHKYNKISQWTYLYVMTEFDLYKALHGSSYLVHVSSRHTGCLLSLSLSLPQEDGFIWETRPSYTGGNECIEHKPLLSFTWISYHANIGGSKGRVNN